MKKRDVTLPAFEEKALDAMVRAAESVRTGVFPPNYESERCSSCPFPSLCRRGDFRPDEAGEEE